MGERTLKKRIIAVDIDGTMGLRDEFPNLGELNEELIEDIKEWKRQGHTIILWTCRTGKNVDNALKIIDEKGVPYDAVNCNCNNPYKEDPRKIYADVYIDDKALNIKDLKYYDVVTNTIVPREDMLKDIEKLVEKIERLSIHSVNPELDLVKSIKRKYNLWECV